MHRHAFFRRKSRYVCKNTGDVDHSMRKDTEQEASAAAKQDHKQKGDCNRPGHLEKIFRKTRFAAVDQTHD